MSSTLNGCCLSFPEQLALSIEPVVEVEQLIGVQHCLNGGTSRTCILQEEWRESSDSGNSGPNGPQGCTNVILPAMGVCVDQLA